VAGFPATSATLFSILNGLHLAAKKHAKRNPLFYQHPGKNRSKKISLITEGDPGSSKRPPNLNTPQKLRQKPKTKIPTEH